MFVPPCSPAAFAKQQGIVAIAGALSSTALLFALAKPTSGRG
jgi:hypothetical protein